MFSHRNGKQKQAFSVPPCPLFSDLLFRFSMVRASLTDIDKLKYKEERSEMSIKKREREIGRILKQNLQLHRLIREKTIKNQFGRHLSIKYHIAYKIN